MNPPPLSVRKQFPWILYGIALVLIAAFAFAPVGSVMLCAWIANAYGCKVDEGSVHPCIINGHDYGELLYDLGVMGWFMLVTIPAAYLHLSFGSSLSSSIVSHGESDSLRRYPRSPARHHRREF